MRHDCRRREYGGSDRSDGLSTRGRHVRLRSKSGNHKKGDQETGVGVGYRNPETEKTEEKFVEG